MQVLLFDLICLSVLEKKNPYIYYISILHTYVGTCLKFSSMTSIDLKQCNVQGMDDNGSTPSSLAIYLTKKERENSRSFKEKITYNTTCAYEPLQ
jgi:hypothetical protein